MKKLTLDLDALNVESFLTAAADDKSGTVHGHITLQCSGGADTCDNCNTAACNTKDVTCSCPTVINYSCEYDTCDLPDCTGPATCEGC